MPNLLRRGIWRLVVLLAIVLANLVPLRSAAAALSGSAPNADSGAPGVVSSAAPGRATSTAGAVAAAASEIPSVQPAATTSDPGLGIRGLSERHVLLLIVQLGVLLLVARLCGEVALRLGQPSVIGQLLAGILLGPTFLGALWPHWKAALFPMEGGQSHLLEVVSWIGVLFLLMLTGLETDVALIRRQGRPVVFVGLAGICIPFALGVGLTFLLPERLLAGAASRVVLSLFLGTLLSVSSVPVIAKILLEMRLLRRNVGQLILAAALTHDTVGWLLLGVVASLAASGRIEATHVARTVAGTGIFLLVCATAGRRLVPRLLRWANDHLRMESALLTIVVVLMLLTAAVTQAIGVHAVLGAFVVGILLRSSPVVGERVLHPLEQVTTAIFAPIFFAAAGLQVNLGVLLDPSLVTAALLLTGAACLGKLGGCYAGARWAGVPHWEATSVGIGTNARGAMGLIVGVLGLSLGILTLDLFSLVVLMAIVTTCITPSLLRWSLGRVAPVGEEAVRLRQEAIQSRSFVGRIRRVLLPTRGGEDAGFAAELIDAVARHQPVEVTGLYVPMNRSDSRAAGALAATRSRLQSASETYHAVITLPGEAAPAVLEELARGYDLLTLGCGPGAGADAAGSVLGDLADTLARDSRVPLLVARAARSPAARLERILLATSTASHSVQAAEFAIAVARAHGAVLTALHVFERGDEELTWLHDYERRAQEAGSDVVEQVRSLGEAYSVAVETVLTRGERAGAEILRIADERRMDLIVLGGSARPTRSLFLGPTISTVLRGAECAVAILRP